VGVPVPAGAEEGEVPPKAAFVFLDRPAVKGEAVAKDQVPRVIGQLLLYGRQTDRAARLVSPSVAACHLEGLRTLLAEIPSGAIAAEPTQEVLGKTSLTRELIQPNWHVPRDLPPEAILKLVDELRTDVLLKQWPQMKLGLLDGKSPKEAANNSAYAIKLAAAILVLSQWFEQAGGQFDFNQLRTQLGLAPLGPINPEQVNVARLPLVRLGRLQIEKLSDDALVTVFRRAAAFRISGVQEKLAQAVVERPLLSGSESQLAAFRILVRSTPDVGAALDYLDRGRKVAEEAGHSSATWDLLELSLRLERGEPGEMQRLMEHIQREHIREPGVAEALTQFLMQIGAIRPTGGGAPAHASAQAAAAAPGIVVPGAGGAAPGKLWTPDSGSGGGGGSGKLWTPD
jgi:hypothetical protein